jgi:hypothetical protein
VRRSLTALLSFAGFDARSAPTGLATRLPTVFSMPVHCRQPLRVSHERSDLVVCTKLVLP